VLRFDDQRAGKNMTRRNDQMRLGAFFHPTGHHVAAWLDPGAQIDAGTNFQHYVQLAQTAEKAKFDLIFLADSIATRDGNLQALRRWPLRHRTGATRRSSRRSGHRTTHLPVT